MAIKAVAHRPWADGRPLADVAGDDPATSGRWASSWYEPAASDDDIDRGVRFALDTPGVHGFCTPGDIGLLPRVLNAATAPRRWLSERQDAIDAMASTELIFPMPH